MTDGEITVQTSDQLASSDFSQFEAYLGSLGLPQDNILADSSQRRIVEDNFPRFILSLSDDIRRDSRYLSKFAAASAIGLFDAALNYIWNEVVVNLRQKSVVYGLDLFYDTAVGGERRDLYEAEEDLSGIKDKVLLDACFKLELISENIYKKLTHILIMRNDIGASHPNDASINAFELMGWLQTCVQEVIHDKPSEAAIQVKAFINNLRTQEDVIDAQTLQHMQSKIKELRTKNIDSLLQTIFGMYVDPKTENVLRKNISLIAPIIWDCAGDGIKYNIGIRLDGYRNNLHKKKFSFGSEFLEFCDGNQYKTIEARTIELDSLLDELVTNHNAYDNFYHEVPPARKINSYVKKESDIPKERTKKLIKTILECRLGNGRYYHQGVSPSGKVVYDEILNKLSDKNIITAIICFYSPSIKVMLSNQYCKKHAVSIFKLFRKNVVSEKIAEILDYLIKNSNGIDKAIRTSEFKKLAASHIKFK